MAYPYRLKPLSGLYFFSIEFPSNDLKLKIENNGGTIFETMNSEVTHYISNSNFVTGLPSKPVVDEKWIDNVIDTISAEPHSNYLDRFSIYLDVETCENEIVLLVRKAVREGGGTFMNTLDSLTTHYIVCQSIPDKDAGYLLSASHKPFIVSHIWLTECCRLKQAVSEEAYLIEIPNSKENKKKKSLKDSLKYEDTSLRLEPSFILSKLLFKDYVFIINLFTDVEVRLILNI
jgi:hypothetical protein